MRARGSGRQASHPESGRLGIASQLLCRQIINTGQAGGNGFPELIFEVGLQPHHSQHRTGNQSHTLLKTGEGQISQSDDIGCGAC